MFRNGKWRGSLTETLAVRYLKQEFLARPEYASARIELLDPSIAYILLQTDKLENSASAFPSFEQVSHIFLPINNNPDPNDAGGGTHWSLLLVSVNDRAAFHYDSAHSMNERFGFRVAERLGRVLGVDLNFQDLPDSPQQANTSDCGVFVCSEIRYLLTSRLLRYTKGDRISMSLGGRDIDAARGRREMLHVIESFRLEGERQRS